MKNRNTEENIMPENEAIEPVEKKKKDRRWLVVLIALLLCFAVAIGGTIIWAVAYIKGEFKFNYNELSSGSENLGFEEAKDEKIINIALFGIDTRNVNSFKGLSDSIMILSVNIKDNKIKLISIMRDSFVPITHNGETTYNKINSAYSKGGPELAVKTLNTIFDLDISEYATVNFYGMADIIDAVGGIEVELTSSEISYINGGIKSHCNALDIDWEPYLVSNAGEQHLNGIQAVAYARIRMTANAEGTSNDYGRTDRQRYVLEKMFDKALKLNAEQMIELVKTVAPMCETSVTYSKAISIAMDILFENPTFAETRIPSQGYLMKQPSTSAGSVVYYDLEFAAKLIHSFIYNNVTPETYISTNGIELKDWYAEGFQPPEIDNESLLGGNNKEE